MAGSTFYLAYGSNCNIEQMKMRCAGAEMLGTTHISGYQLVYRRGFLTLLPDDSSRTQCSVWKLTDENVQELDRYEGFPYLYKKQTYPLDIGSEKVEDALIYIMQPEFLQDYTYPSKQYQEICKRGYEECGMDPAQLEAALQEITQQSMSGLILRSMIDHPSIMDMETPYESEDKISKQSALPPLVSTQKMNFTRRTVSKNASKVSMQPLKTRVKASSGITVPFGTTQKRMIEKKKISVKSSAQIKANEHLKIQVSDMQLEGTPIEILEAWRINNERMVGDVALPEFFDILCNRFYHLSGEKISLTGKLERDTRTLFDKMNQFGILRYIGTKSKKGKSKGMKK